MADTQKHQVEFNHLIILAKEKQKTADFITQLLDLPDAVTADSHITDFFLYIKFDNGVDNADYSIKTHWIDHYAFKVSNRHFEQIVIKLNDSKQEYWADNRMQKPFECYEEAGNKEFYVIDLSGHGLEVLTQN